MKLQEALDLLQDPEKLRIRAAEMDVEDSSYQCPQHGTVPDDRVGDAMGCPWCGSYCERECPNYPADANALHEAEKRLGLHERSNTALRVKWVNFLHDLMGKQPGCPVNKVGSPTVSDIDCLLAPTPVRCAAYVMAAEWKKLNQPEKP